MTNVYTCTMNLAIDLFIETQTLKPNRVNRTIDDDIQANGKGVNVSLILKKLAVDSTAIGFSGGFTGNYIQEFLANKGINTAFIPVCGNTRINVFTQVTEPPAEYKLVNKGPLILPEQLTALLHKIRGIQAGDLLVISGSLPQGVTPDIFVKISQIAQEKQVHLVIDSSNRSIMDCLQYHPYLLKPNEEELAQWFDKSAIAFNEYSQYLEKLIALGAQRVLLSLGSLGCMYADNQQILYGNAPKGKVVNTACAGDTLLAVFVKNLLMNETIPTALKQSIAAGSSTAFRKGLTDFSDTAQLEKQIVIKTINRKEG